MQDDVCILKSVVATVIWDNSNQLPILFRVKLITLLPCTSEAIRTRLKSFGSIGFSQAASTVEKMEVMWYISFWTVYHVAQCYSVLPCCQSGYSESSHLDPSYFSSCLHTRVGMSLLAWCKKTFAFCPIKKVLLNVRKCKGQCQCVASNVSSMSSSQLVTLNLSWLLVAINTWTFL